MKKAIMLLGWILIANTLIGQQILSVYSGYQPMIYHTRELDDKMTSLTLEPGLGGLLGVELKYTNKKEVSSVFSVDYSYTAFHLTSSWVNEPKFGNNNLDMQLNYAVFGYQIEYTWDRRIQFYIAGGPSMAWLFYNSVNGYLIKSEDIFTSIETDTVYYGGKVKGKMTSGVFSLQFKTGIKIPIRQKMWWNLGIGLRADLNNQAESDFVNVVNTAINQMIFVQIYTGLSFNLGDILSVKPVEED
ncbi:MAG: hypothetical protein K9I34_00080 [Bacteroidales bacterium]|nr:hypothetical protein [Bacteroidales bacterium]